MRPLVFAQERPTQFDAPLFRALRGRGVPLTVLYQHASGALDPELLRQPDFGDLLSGYEWREVRGTERLDRQAGIHLVVAGWSTRWAWSYLLNQRPTTLGIRFDTTLRTSPPTWLRRLRSRIALRSSTHWHPVGGAAANYAKEVSSVIRPIVPIPYAIDTTQYNVITDRRWGVNGVDSPLTVLCVAKLAVREDPSVVIDACSRLSDVHLIIVGDGPLRAALETHAENMGVSADFTGYIQYERLPEFYAKADVFVHASTSEPWGVSVHEAMASGLPVLASRTTGSADDLLTDDLRFDAGDPAALARLIADLRPPKVRQQLSIGNRLAANTITPGQTADALVRFLSSSAQEDLS